jgi:hypothetical protein
MRKMLIGAALCTCLVLPSAINSFSSVAADDTIEAITSSVDMAVVHVSTTTNMIEEWEEAIIPIDFPPEGPQPIIPPAL